LEDTANSDAFQLLVTGIEEAQKGLERAQNGINSLVSGGGFDGFVREFVDTEESRIEKAINDLSAMQNANSELQKAVQKAQEILDRNGPRLERELAEADEEIERIQEDSKLAELQRDYEYQLKVHDKVHNVIEGMNAGLETIKENWKAGMQELQNVVDEIQKAIASVFHIERIEVSAHTHALVNNKPLEFKFHGKLAGERFDIEAKWSPDQSLKVLYKAVTNEILKIA
jgi:molecular chaperone GrpE (heat shock protein)